MSATFSQYTFQLNGRGLTDPTLPLGTSNIEFILDEFALNGVSIGLALIPGADVTAITAAITAAVAAIPGSGLVVGVGGYVGTPTYSLQSATPILLGYGYAVGDTVTLPGGAVVTVATLNAGHVHAVVAAPGAGYVLGENISLLDGLVLKVTGVTGYATGATIGAAGTGYAVNDTLTLPDGVVAKVATIGTNGVIETLTITAAGAVDSADAAAGNFPPEPITPTATSGAGTGATVYLEWTLGVAAVTVFEPGIITSATSFTNPEAQVTSSGVGHGATFTLSWTYGPATVTVTTPGSETVLPANPVPQVSTNHAGLGAQFQLAWQSNLYASAVAVTAAGTGYAVGNTITLADGVIVKVTTIGTNGIVTGLSITGQGNAVPGATPANPVAQTATSGAGTGFTGTITWAPQA